MSTDDQEHSIANQHDAIEAYAGKNGIEIVRTYADAGKSGLTIAGRPGLRQLMADVQTGAADFSLILVYDVSRWGRFQDADEGAYYEYLCRRAGISIVYCAEQFSNDQSIGSTIIKNIKRAMAGEYSRELSAKTFAGQARIARMGYRLGGPAMYGYRRMLLGQGGRPKGMMKFGERKSIETDRIMLVPGPPEEIRTVRWIYRTYATGHLAPVDIARKLTRRKVPPPGKRWAQHTILRILSNEAYAGTNVWNRKSAKLRSGQVQNKPDLWVRHDNAHEAIVDRKLFGQVQKVLESRRLPRLSSAELLRRLKAAWKRHRRLTQKIVNADPQLPHTHSYWYRFGSIMRAYELIGYRPSQRMLTRQKNRPITRWHMKKEKPAKDEDGFPAESIRFTL